MASDSRKDVGKSNPIVTASRKKGKDQTKKYKSVHSIGSRKLREKFVSYNDTYPMYESVLQVYLDSKKETMATTKHEKKTNKRKHDELKEPNNNVVVKPDKKVVLKDKTAKKAKLEKKDSSSSETKSMKSNSDGSEKSAEKDKKSRSKKKLKENTKKKNNNEFNVYQFMRLKREASLNASARVNIMFEKLPSPRKKSKPEQNNISKKEKAVTGTAVKDKPVKDKAVKDKAVKDKAVKDKVKIKKRSTEKVSKDKSTVKKDNSCKDKVEEVKKQRDEIIKCRKHQIEEKKKKANLNKDGKPKTKVTESKENCVKGIKKLLTKCKNKDKTKDKNSNGQKKKEKKKDVLKKKVNDKMSSLVKTGKRMASLNAKALMAASKEVRPSMERAARIDRFCVAWNRVTMPQKHVEPVARWVEGLGSTLCCTTEASVCISKKEQQICEESKATAATPVMAAIQKQTPCPMPESDMISDDRPSSVVDVVGAHTPAKPLSRTPHCLSPIFSSGQNCVPPCNGYSCGSGSERFVTSQYQSLTLGGIRSLSSIQMMSYNPQSPYRSAFSVPFNHTGLPPYGYYGGGFYQASPPTVLHQPTLEACLLPHHLPVHVPHAQVKVLIHNPDSTHDCAFTSYTKQQERETFEDPTVTSKKAKSDSKARSENPKQKKKVEPRRSKSPKDDGDGMVTEKTEPDVQRLATSPPHNWSWFGEPEMKMVPTLVEGPPVERKCYPAIQHSDGDLIHVRDCVLLRSGPRKKDIPFVAKVSALWEYPDNGEMMMSLLWYYRPEHTEIGRKPHHVDCEVFASKHRDENSVACIDDKGYVLTFNEFCRYRAEVLRNDQVSCSSAKSKVVPHMDSDSPITHRMPGINIDPSTVFICRQVYDFRQKRMLKNPS